MIIIEPTIYTNKLEFSDYSPSILEKLFDSKIKELKKCLSKEDSQNTEKVRYSLETLCKEFLDILIYEKPKNI